MIIHQYQEITTMTVKQDGKEVTVPCVLNVTETYHDDGRRDCNIHVPTLGAAARSELKGET